MAVTQPTTLNIGLLKSLNGYAGQIDACEVGISSDYQNRPIVAVAQEKSTKSWELTIFVFSAHGALERVAGRFDLNSRKKEEIHLTDMNGLTDALKNLSSTKILTLSERANILEEAISACLDKEGVFVTPFGRIRAHRNTSTHPDRKGDLILSILDSELAEWHEYTGGAHKGSFRRVATGAGGVTVTAFLADANIYIPYLNRQYFVTTSPKEPVAM